MIAATPIPMSEMRLLARVWNGAYQFKLVPMLEDTEPVPPPDDVLTE